jgi:hypothetical protein
MTTQNELVVAAYCFGMESGAYHVLDLIDEGVRAMPYGSL